MNWTDVLTSQATESYRILAGIVNKVDGQALDWRPETGKNWMTTGQLLEHMKTACGAVMNGFATGDWAAVMPEGEMGEDGAMPNADALPTCSSLEEFKKAIEQDRDLALRTIDAAGEDALNEKMLTAPWNPTERVFGVQLNECIEHLNSHKAQLFYYLKLQGQDVNTMDLWGI